MTSLFVATQSRRTNQMRYLTTLLMLFALPFRAGSEHTAAAVASEPQEGTFWVDRWGQGRFAPYGDFVNESMFPKLRPYVGTPVQLIAPRVEQDSYDGAECVTSFGSIKGLPQPVSIHLSWMTDTKDLPDAIWRMRSAEEAVLKIQVTNKSNDELILDTKDLKFHPTIRQPDNSLQRAYGLKPGARKQGVWRYVSRSVNLFPQGSHDESDLAPINEVKIGAQTIVADKPRKQPRDLWKLAVIAGLIVLMAEWWIYNKRVQI